MRINQDKLNTACNFHSVNQGDEKLTRMMCTIYAPFINARYNGVIKGFTEQDIKDVAEICNKKWTFSYTNGGYGSDWVYAFQEWLLKEQGIRCTVISTKDDTEALKWTERWYATLLGIKYNSYFAKDIKDGKIDTKDYKDLRWKNGHFTNVIKWTSRGEFNSSEDGKEMFLDSYFITNSTYECDLKEVFEDLDMPTKYIII